MITFYFTLYPTDEIKSKLYYSHLT